MYSRPEVGDNKAIYKGKRYWVVELSGTTSVDGIDPSDCDYIVFDGVYGAVTATIENLENGKFWVSLMTQVDSSYEFDDISSAVKALPKLYAWYYRDF